jgi:hypothetical protein
MSRFIIITSADARYFPLASDLIASIRTFAGSSGIPLGFLDLGLLAEQRDQLVQAGVAVVEPGWDCDFSGHPAAVKSYMRCHTARPHLPRYFPGHDVYLHMDADTWLQDWEAIELYVSAALERGFAITAELDRSYAIRFGDAFDIDVKLETYRPYFPEPAAMQLAHRAQLNSGVFAAVPSTPHWQAWHSLLTSIYADLGRRPSYPDLVLFYAEQAALNAVLRTAREPPALLPAWCNWVCHRAMPLCSTDGKVLLEPNPPYRPLGVIHMSGPTKDGEFDLRDRSGGRHRRSLRYAPA